jgi:hypothetical protein
MLTYVLLVVYMLTLIVIPSGVVSLNLNILSLKYICIISMARKLRQLKVSAESI